MDKPTDTLPPRQTGGVTLVLGAAYLSLQAHQRNRLQQAETLRAQTYILQSLTYVPASAPPPKTIAEELALLEQQQSLLTLAEARRAERLGRGAAVSGFLERAKDRWNAEVEGAVRWAAAKDWVAAREDAEDAAARVWARLSGGEPPARSAERARDALADGAAAAAAATRSSVGQAAARTRDVARAKTGEAEEAAAGIWERGFRRGKEVAAQAKAAVGLAEEKAEKKVSELAGAVSDDVEKALQQRYQRNHEEVLNRDVDEVLAERYKPVEQQDHSKLRGV